MTQRAVPFYCPYCGDEDIQPYIPADESSSGHGSWWCQCCRRAWKLSMIGTGTPAQGPLKSPEAGSGASGSA